MSTPVSYCKEVNKETMDNIYKEVKSNFTKYELIEFEDFEEFFNEVDSMNGYEESWENDKDFYKPFYQNVYEKILKEG